MERLKNMGLKKSFLLLSLSCLAVAFLLLGAVIFLCRGIENYYPLGGVEILSDGSIVPLPSPTASQQRILAILNIVQTLSCILFPVGGLIVSVFLFYYLKLKQPISCLQNGIMRIQNNDLDFSLPILSNDEMGQLTADFNHMAEALEQNIQNLENEVRAREDFIAAFSHELKTPLTAIIGYADMLRSRKLDEEKHFLCANYIYTEGKRLETMALRLLDIIVTRRKEIDRKTTNVSGIFSYLQEIYDETKNPEDSRVKVDICWEKGELYAEENLLKTVLINLTDNAIKASEEGQTVEITGRHMENGYYFQVRDEGIGIPKEELHKITEAFYMVDKSRSRAHNGAGLGLALCTAILELHHSSLKIESTQGFGSCMSFLIPDEGVKSDE